MAGVSPKRQFLNTITGHYLIAAFNPDGGDCQGNEYAEYASWLCDVGSVDVTQRLVPHGLTNHHHRV